MEHESFENPDIAGLMNEWFVCIKVDREERPDLDQIYMNSVQAMTGSGGWPMSVFLTPDVKPFYGGTYWPPTARWGRPGFREILAGVHEAWQNRRQSVEEQADELTGHVQKMSRTIGGSRQPLNDETLLAAMQTINVRAADRVHGGLRFCSANFHIQWIFDLHCGAGGGSAMGKRLKVRRLMLLRPLR